MTEPRSTPDPTDRKPRDDEIDVFGLTHPGKVRKANQDHFLICSLRKCVDVHGTSLPSIENLPLGGERVAFLAMVADGVGGGAKGETASRLALQAVTRYVADSLRCYYDSNTTNDQEFLDALQNAALESHANVTHEAQDHPDCRGMATTLTLWMGIWPRSYLLQVGDSRLYVFRDCVLTQITRDQTMAQELVDQGVLTRSGAFSTPWANVLSSSIGGRQTEPVVTRLDQAWGAVGLICSDGLTKHVSDEQIAERLENMTSAKQACEDLIQDALDGGGTDNVTVIVGRSVRKD